MAPEHVTRIIPWYKELEGAAENPEAFFMEERCIYWVAILTPPTHPSRSYAIRGQFPRSRFFSLQSYISTSPVDALYDFQINPDEGSCNPFRSGNADPSDGAHLNYEIRLVGVRSRDEIPKERPANTLYAISDEKNRYILLYRIYWNELAEDAAVPEDYTRRQWEKQGQKPLPQILVMTWDGVDPRPAPSGKGEGGVVGRISPGIMARFQESQHLSPQEKTRLLSVGCPWTIGNPYGGYANSAVVYLQADFDDSQGEVAVCRIKSPSFPNTDAGQIIDPQHQQTRYWSFCTHIPGTIWTAACKSDYRFVADDDGWVTVVFSALDKRPANARNWLPYVWDDRHQRNGALVCYRIMVPSEETFPGSPYFYAKACELCYPLFSAEYFQALENGPAIAHFAGAYYPRTCYCSKSDFERYGYKIIDR
ncbi:MAG TPA: hypothetical protein PKJ77_08810 [Thermodesulfobacteriota bacterium]|nr:hypothetical protein [Thermodesulfobacteriota bacterium]HOC39365.1 hypothetical protein [Thermodesulfobacteriota bacterium]